MFKNVILLGFCLLSLVGCATVSRADLNLAASRFVIYALTRPVAELETGAKADKAEDQFTLSLVYKYGLQNVSVDPVKAQNLLKQATRQRGTTAINQYIPAFQGRPASQNIINVPRYDLTVSDMLGAQACAEAINTSQFTAEGFESCGYEDQFWRLYDRWHGTDYVEKRRQARAFGKN